MRILSKNQDRFILSGVNEDGDKGLISVRVNAITEMQYIDIDHKRFLHIFLTDDSIITFADCSRASAKELMYQVDYWQRQKEMELS